jgi:two-component system cell cycle response regulator DivK
MPHRVLIVEDTPENMYALKRVFQHEGFEIIEATDGQEAILKSINEKPDVILMDMQLPGLSGYEAAERIRKKLPALPIIAITADALPGDREKALELGCIAYFSKPIRYREIIDAVREILNRPAD